MISLTEIQLKVADYSSDKYKYLYCLTICSNLTIFSMIKRIYSHVDTFPDPYLQKTETTYRTGNTELDSEAEKEYKLKKLEEMCVPQAERDFLKLDGIELESYFRRIPRKECEALLANKDAGTCIVRPYKEFVRKLNKYANNESQY